MTSAAHGRRSPKRNMTLTRTASAYAYQAADTRHTKLTSQAGTTRATRFYGARHGRIFQTPTLNAPDTRSVSTTAATAERGIRRAAHRPHGRSGLSNGEERHSHRERRAEPEYPKGKPPYPGNQGADWKAQRMDWRTVSRRGKPPRSSPRNPPGLANLLMKYLSVQREKSRKYSQSWQRAARRPMN